MKGLIEKRQVPFEVRSEGDGKLRGRAVVFNSETVIGGTFREIIRPGALTKTLTDGRDIKMLWQHKTEFPMGSTRAGTLIFDLAQEGLDLENDPPKQAPYSGFVENIQRGDVDSMSFGFEVIQEVVTRGRDGEMDLREITEIKLYEVSPVTFPAYSDTEIALRAAEVVSTWVKAEDRNDASVGDDPINDVSGDDTRTTHEAATNACTSSEPDGTAPDYILNRCELLAAEQERTDEDYSLIEGQAV